MMTTHSGSAAIHQDAVAVLLAAAAASPPAAGPTAEERAAAEVHVAGCALCWDILSRVYEAAVGEPPPGDADMRALCGCETVREQLCQLDLAPDERIRQEHPDLAAHLASCEPCREHLALLRDVSQAEARGHLGPPLVDATLVQYLTPTGEVLVRKKGET